MSFIRLTFEEQLEMNRILDLLLLELERITVPLNLKENISIEKVRSQTFGVVCPKYGKKIPKAAVSNTKYSRIYNLLLQLGNVIAFPIDWTSIQLNNNVVCKPHIDKNNKGLSVIVSFGDYSGNNLVISNKQFDTYKRPLLFDGSQVHYNTPQKAGCKYSLTYFTI